MYSCSDLSNYEKLVKVGQGTFGEVHKAKDRKKGNFVALKKVLKDNKSEGIQMTTIREVKILQLVAHENIVKLIEVCSSMSEHGKSSAEQTFHLVFEFCEHDLAGLLSNPNVKFSVGHIKMIMKQLLNALYYIHANYIIHRDVKTANILMTKKGVLKLADFGLARPISSHNRDEPQYTNKVVTLWYRPPELLLGERNYGSAIDVWGAGCIMAELWTKRPILQGTSEQHQIKLIIDLCGSINPDSYQGVDKLELYRSIELKQGEKRKIKKRLQAYLKDSYALDLLDELLIIDPAKRIDCDRALNHNFFWEDPLPCELTEMLSQYKRSMFEYAMRNDEENNRGAPCAKRFKPNKMADDGQYQDRVF